MKLYNSLTFQKVNTPQCWKATHNPFVTSQRVVGTSSRLVAVALWSRPEVDCHKMFGQVERKDFFFKKCLLRKAVNRGLRRLFSGIYCIWCHKEPFQNSCYGPANRQPTTSTSSDSDAHDFSHVASTLTLVHLFHPVLFFSFVFFSSPYNFPRKRFHAAAWVFEWWSNYSVGGDNPHTHTHTPYRTGTAAGVPLSKGKRQPGCRSAGTHQTISMCCPLVVESGGGWTAQQKASAPDSLSHEAD